MGAGALVAAIWVYQSGVSKYVMPNHWPGIECE